MSTDALPKEQQSMPVPVIILSGSMGAGKTEVLKSILQNKNDLRIAVIMNETADVGIDARQLRDPRMQNRPAKVLEITGGCICCTLRATFLSQLDDLRNQGCYDCILVEAAGVGEPLHIAENFALIQDVVRLDTLVTVVDVVNVMAVLKSLSLLARCGRSGRIAVVAKHRFARPATLLLADQIEFANVIVLNKCDQISKADISQIHDVVQQLNPSAVIYESIKGSIPLDALVNTGKFSMAEAEADERWFLEACENNPKRHLQVKADISGTDMPQFSPPKRATTSGKRDATRRQFCVGYKEVNPCECDDCEPAT